VRETDISVERLGKSVSTFVRCDGGCTFEANMCIRHRDILVSMAILVRCLTIVLTNLHC
jgi:hypothetical protein